jgi:hypothetical protein
LYVTKELFEIFRAHARSAADLLAVNNNRPLSLVESLGAPKLDSSDDDDYSNQHHHATGEGLDSVHENVDSGGQVITPQSLTRSPSPPATTTPSTVDDEHCNTNCEKSDCDTDSTGSGCSDNDDETVSTAVVAIETKASSLNHSQLVACSFSSAEGIISSPFSTLGRCRRSDSKPFPLNAEQEENPIPIRPLSQAKSRSSSTPVPFTGSSGGANGKEDDGSDRLLLIEPSATSVRHQTIRQPHQRRKSAANYNYYRRQRNNQTGNGREILGQESSVALIPFDLPRTPAVDPEQVDAASLKTSSLLFPTTRQRGRSVCIGERLRQQQQLLQPRSTTQSQTPAHEANDSWEHRRLDKMRAVLEAYVCFRPDVGYVQGMSCLASMLAGTGPQMTAYDMFVCLSNLLHRPLLRTFYSMKPLAIQPYLLVHKSMIAAHLPALAAQLTELGLEPDMYLYEWVCFVCIQCKFD